MFAGSGVVLPPGLYAFTDGNAAGGVGLVIVRVPNPATDPAVEAEAATNVREVLAEAAIPGLDTDTAVAEALGRLRNILAEMAALYAAIRELPDGEEATVVHDYAGVGAFFEGRWPAHDPTVRAVLVACGLGTD